MPPMATGLLGAVIPEHFADIALVETDMVENAGDPLALNDARFNVTGPHRVVRVIC